MEGVNLSTVCELFTLAGELVRSAGDEGLCLPYWGAAFLLAGPILLVSSLVNVRNRPLEAALRA
jgi:hypothetical protein